MKVVGATDQPLNITKLSSSLSVFASFVTFCLSLVLRVGSRKVKFKGLGGRNRWEEIDSFARPVMWEKKPQGLNEWWQTAPKNKGSRLASRPARRRKGAQRTNPRENCLGGGADEMTI